MAEISNEGLLGWDMLTNEEQEAYATVVGAERAMAIMAFAAIRSVTENPDQLRDRLVGVPLEKLRDLTTQLGKIAAILGFHDNEVGVSINSNTDASDVVSGEVSSFTLRNPIVPAPSPLEEKIATIERSDSPSVMKATSIDAILRQLTNEAPKTVTDKVIRHQVGFVSDAIDARNGNNLDLIADITYEQLKEVIIVLGSLYKPHNIKGRTTAPHYERLKRFAEGYSDEEIAAYETGVKATAILQSRLALAKKLKEQYTTDELVTKIREMLNPADDETIVHQQRLGDDDSHPPLEVTSSSSVSIGADQETPETTLARIEEPKPEIEVDETVEGGHQDNANEVLSPEETLLNAVEAYCSGMQLSNAEKEAIVARLDIDQTVAVSPDFTKVAALLRNQLFRPSSTRVAKFTRLEEAVLRVFVGIGGTPPKAGQGISMLYRSAFAGEKTDYYSVMTNIFSKSTPVKQ
jgi:hypothetical protein